MAVDWMEFARRAWKRITHAGVTPHTPSALRKRLIVTNLFALTVGGITAFWFAVYSLMWIPILEDLMFVLIAISAAVPWLNARGYHGSSRLTILCISSFAGAAYALVMGPKAGILIMFLPLVCAPLVLFDLRERALLAITLPLPVLLAVGVQWYQADHPALIDLPHEVIERAASISLVTATVLVAAMMGFLYSVHASAAARLERSYQELLRKSDEVVLFVARDGNITDANQEVEQQLGHQRPQLLGMPIWRIDISLTPSDWSDLVRRLEAGGPALLQHKLQRRDGSCYMVEIRLGLVSEGAGCVILAARDISQRSEIEARLRVADRLVSVGTLAAGVAHEVNNPLAYIMLNLQRVRRRIAESQNGLRDEERREVLESLEMALEGSAKVSTIVNDLRTFARGSQRERSAVNIERVLQSTLKLARLELGSHAEVVTDFAEVPDVWGNEARLAQVALNLFLNGVQAMKGRGKGNVLHVSTATDSLGRVVVRVSDTGHGIPEADLNRIFDPFFTTRHAEGGTGLGLYVCRSIVTECGGEITVQSQVDRGTTFQLTLPAAHSARTGAGIDAPAVLDSNA
ncbi:MAG TPA: ATP-binding protein [Polyangiaceae bacterium]|nr:ATP-binding protein [Polyangiaceae bacterium]